MPIFILATMTGLFFAFNGFFYFNAPHFVIPLNDLALMTLFELGAIVGVCWLAVAFAQSRARPLAWLAAAWVLLNRHRGTAVAPGLVLCIVTGTAWWAVQQGSHWESPLRALITTAQAAYGQPPSVALGSENGTYPDLTPHIDAFAVRSMRVERFFNHTAATFRGLQGMLTSGYPYHGGYSRGGWVTGRQGTIDRLSAIRYASLPGILHSHGYQTTFISPHSNANPLNDMLRALDFATVVAFEDYPDYLEGPLHPHPDIAGAAIDQDLFRMTCAWLQSAAAETEAKAPFLLSLYNIGTHAFTDMPPLALIPVPSFTRMAVMPRSTACMTLIGFGGSLLSALSTAAWLTTPL